jgi:hypothetical protein
MLLMLGGCSDRYQYEDKGSSWKFWEKEEKSKSWLPWSKDEEETDKPSRVFRERCESVQAFHIFKDHKNHWACKLPDGRVLTDN